MVVFLAKKTKEVEVPSVVGKSFISVYNDLIRKEFKPEITFRDFFEEEEGIILKQYPSSGEIVSAGSLLKLVLSRSSLKLETPNLVGKKLSKAKSKLNNFHALGRSFSLSTGIISYVPSDKVADFVIIDQNPKEGERISPNQKINLLVSSGKMGDDHKMPNLINQSIDLCYDLLLTKEVVIKEEMVLTKDLSKSGLIISQNPRSGQKIKKGKDVFLKILYYPLTDRPYFGYEKISYKIPEEGEKGFYKAVVEDENSKRIRFFQTKKSGQEITFLFYRKGNAKVSIFRDNKIVEVFKRDVI